MVPRGHISRTDFKLKGRAARRNRRLDSNGTKREHWGMSVAPETGTPAADDLDTAADQAIAACGGDAREAVKALIVANGFWNRRSRNCRRPCRPAARAVGWIVRRIARTGTTEN